MNGYVQPMSTAPAPYATRVQRHSDEASEDELVVGFVVLTAALCRLESRGPVAYDPILSGAPAGRFTVHGVQQASGQLALQPLPVGDVFQHGSVHGGSIAAVGGQASFEHWPRSTLPSSRD